MTSPYYTINGISNALPTQAANTSEDIGQEFAFDFDPADSTHMVRLIEGVIGLGSCLCPVASFTDMV